MFWLDFLVFLFACMAAGLTGSLFPPGEWYSELNKPVWTPPNWVFPVAWPILYLLMSYSGATLANLESAGSALALWALQISLNTLWTPVFFGLKNLKLGLIIIILLLVSVAICTYVFWLYAWISGLLFLPYLAWVVFAAALNAAVFKLN
ncbi:MAG: tryptophan-rich sensory protein [Paracoccaceae bacterium]|jgi:tryptophan-rich sensory protein|nr:tryptophan-rich sensory protein [Paracoccaceae bacterium]MDG1765140.1 tryptophan-rich sensory protein [Paracoccaceae bacterium]MDG2430773.1 tryptophan-rich sensory protein [Paracoccaceae bacterium]|tara:strand:- start:132 stop:578 length:447 start_codon:yes stop_codon:yes gene_type:complete